MERCKETIEEASLALEGKKLFNAENRIYYSIFYIVSALAIKNGYSTSKHFQLLGWFNKTYVKTGIVSSELSRIYYRAFEKRQEGDYEDLKYFTYEEVSEDFVNMKTLLRKLKD